METRTGGCMCGKVKFSVSGEPYRVGICHCMDCRKHHGGLFHASAIFPQDSVRIEGETGSYNGRFFCQNCGSSVFGKSNDEIELNIGSFDSTNQFEPTYELWTIRREAWLPDFPSLKQYDQDRDTQSRQEDGR